jgi:hypothetical protein
MATRTISDAGGNWNDTAAWVEGAVPVLGDDVVATATSGDLTVNVNTAGVGLDFTNYVSTLHVTSTLELQNTKSFILSASMTITSAGGSPRLFTANLGTITSNGKVWPMAWLKGGSSSVTLTEDFTITGTFTQSGGSGGAINGFTLYIGGGLSISDSCPGTTTFVLNGTGTWSGSSSLSKNLTINTAGTITLATNILYSTGTFTYVAGTVVTGTNIFQIGNNATLDTNGISFYNITMTSSATTLTINSLLTVTNAFKLANNNMTFAGTSGFSVYYFNAISAMNRTITLTAGNTYNITNVCRFIPSQDVNLPTDVINTNLVSSHGTNTVALVLSPGCYQVMAFIHGTRIDSSGGDPILFFKGTSTDCVNWTEADGGGGPLPMVSYVKS